MLYPFAGERRAAASPHASRGARRVAGAGGGAGPGRWTPPCNPEAARRGAAHARATLTGMALGARLPRAAAARRRTRAAQGRHGAGRRPPPQKRAAGGEGELARARGNAEIATAGDWQARAAAAAAVVAAAALTACAPPPAEALPLREALSSALKNGSIGSVGDDESSFAPFTLYGTVNKRFEVLRLGGPSGEDIVGRAPGVTVDVCVAAYSAAMEGGDAGRFVPSKMEGAECASAAAETAPGIDVTQGAAKAALLGAAGEACNASCAASGAKYAAREQRLSGLPPSAEALRAAADTCVATCTDEAAKTGFGRNFTLRLRP